jgi:lipoprotein-releasing system permease protein
VIQSPLAATLMILAVAAGIAFQIPNTANLSGYEREILRQGVNAGFGDVRVRPHRGQQLHGVPALISDLETRPGVTAVVPILTLAGAAGVGQGFDDAVVIGIDANAARRPYYLLRGEELRAGDDRGVVIGSALARRIGVDVGDEVQVRVILTMGSDLAGEDAIGRYTMIVRGVAASGFVAPSALIIDRGFLGKELGVTDAASMILVHGDDHWAAREIATRINHDHSEVQAISWGEDNPFLDAAVRSSGTVGSVSYAMVMIAIIIPVWALLYISVLHRQRQVALLSAIGFGRRAIFFAFLLQSLAVGIVGVAIGCVGGYGLIRYFDAHPIFEMEGFVISPARTLRTYLEPAMIVLAATVVAGVWPAHRASRLDPSRILRAGR